MPSWSIHLALAKKVSEKYKLDNNSFYYGNLLPDVDLSLQKNLRYKTHFCENLMYEEYNNEHKIDLDKFKNTYKDNLNNSLIIGYYTHLLADLYFNTYFYKSRFVLDENKNIIGIKNIKNKVLPYSTNLRKKLKHKDFQTFAKYIYKKVGNPKIYYESVFENKEILKNEEFLNRDLIMKRIKFLNNKHIKMNKYSLKEKIFGLKFCCLPLEEYQKLFDETYNFICEKLNEIGVERI